MINFACKKFDFGEVVRCSLGLTKTEFKIMEYLVKDSSEEFTSLEVSKIFKIGLSTSQKAIKKLYSGGLLMRSQRNFGSGGYIFVYSINRKHLLKKKILKIIDSWVLNVEREIEKW